MCSLLLPCCTCAAAGSTCQQVLHPASTPEVLWPWGFTASASPTQVSELSGKGVEISVTAAGGVEWSEADLSGARCNDVCWCGREACALCSAAELIARRSLV